MNNIEKQILTEMCKRVGKKYQDIDFTKDEWYLQYSWTWDDQEKFIDWLVNWLWEDKNRLTSITAFPHLTKHNRTEVERVVDYFILNYGWRVKD